MTATGDGASGAETGRAETGGGRRVRWDASAVLFVALVTGLVLAWLASIRLLAPDTPNIILGLWQWSDAAAYDWGGLSLLAEGRLDEWNTRRPTTAAVIAVLHATSHGSVGWAQAWLAGLNGVAIGAVGLLLWRRVGLPSAVAACLILLFFYREAIGTVLSENIGLALGCAALVMLWSGVVERRRWLIALGLFALAMALNARAGAYFVLPAIIVWLSVNAWRAGGGGLRRRAIAAFTVAGLWSAAAGLAGFLPNAWLLAWFGTGDGLPFGNFAPTLYGLVAGGEGWTRVYEVHPALQAMNDSQAFPLIFQLAWERFAAAPGDLVWGILRVYNQFFFQNGPRILTTALTLLGLWRIWRHPRRAEHGLLLAGLVGTWLSVPFLADGGLRVFAATIPFLAVVMALGAACLDRLPRWRPAGLPTGAGLAMAVVAVILAAVGPGTAIVAGRAAPVQPAASACPPGEVAATVFWRAGMAAVIGRPVSRAADRHDGRTVLEWRVEPDRLLAARPDMPLQPLTEGMVILPSYDHVAARGGWFLMPRAIEPATETWVALCGRWESPMLFRGSPARS